MWPARCFHISLAEKLTSAEKEAAAKGEQLKEIMQECEELELEIARNKKLQIALRRENMKLKKQVNELDDQVKTTGWALQEAEAEEARLKKQIVSSPERRKAELADSKQQLKTEKDECARLEAAVQECKAKYLKGLKLYQRLQLCLKDMAVIQQDANNHAEMAKKVRASADRIETIKKKTAETNQKIADTERDVARLEDKIKTQRKQHQMKLDALSEALDEAKNQLLQVEKNRLL